MKMKRLILIKFGGSFITDKSREETVNKKNIGILVGQFKEVLAKSPETFFILGTGAGSFGHLHVDKYDLERGVKSYSQKLGFCLTEESVSRLNQIVLATLLAEGIPAISVKPSSIFINKNKQVKKIFLDPIVNFLNLGLVPLIYGDMVYDEETGGSVLSTDKEFFELVLSLRKSSFSVEKVIFCGATNGVLDERGETIDNINKKTFPAIKKVFFENPYIDVTGGMKKKVEVALKIADLGIKNYIINGRSLADCIIKNKFLGTAIT